MKCAIGMRSWLSRELQIDTAIRPEYLACACKGQLGSTVGQDRHDHRSLTAGPIELTEEDILPAGKAQAAVYDRDCFTGTHYARLQVAIAVTVLPVVKPHPPGDELLHE